MRLQKQFAVKLISAIAALLVLSICTGALRVADQPKAGGAKKELARKNPNSLAVTPAKRRTALVMLGSKDRWHMRPEQVDAFAGLLTGYCQLAANFS